MPAGNDSLMVSITDEMPAATNVIGDTADS